MELLPIVDRVRLSTISRCDAERARDYFGALADEAQTACERLREALATGDEHALHEIAHSLKGMALEIGAPRLAAAAAALESERDPALHAAFVDAIVEVTAEVRHALPTL